MSILGVKVQVGENPVHGHMSHCMGQEHWMQGWVRYCAWSISTQGALEYLVLPAHMDVQAVFSQAEPDCPRSRPHAPMHAIPRVHVSMGLHVLV